METIQPVIAVVGVLGLLVVLLFALRKKGIVEFRTPQGRQAARRIEMLEKLSLSPQHALHMVRAGDRCLLIATSPSGCQVVESFPGAEVQK